MNDFDTQELREKILDIARMVGAIDAESDDEIPTLKAKVVSSQLHSMKQRISDIEATLLEGDRDWIKSKKGSKQKDRP